MCWPLAKEISLKDISIFSSGGHVVQTRWTFWLILVENISVKLFWIRTSSLFKNVHYLELWLRFCSAQPNHLCNFGIGNYEEQLCESILNLDHWFRICHLKDFWSGALAAPVRWSGTICAILKEGIMGNIHVKLYGNLTSGLGGDVV